MFVKDRNYNWAAMQQNLTSVCPTKLDSNQFTQLQRLARKIKAVAQSYYQTYLVTYVSSNQQCERSILKLRLSPLYFWWCQQQMPPVKEHFQFCTEWSTMTQTRMNNLITLHVHKERLESNRERVHCKKRTTKVRVWKVLIQLFSF